MKIYYSRMGKIDGLWNWVYGSWRIHTPTGYLRYKTEQGVRYFGLTLVSVERNKYGGVL